MSKHKLSSYPAFICDFVSSLTARSTSSINENDVEMNHENDIEMLISDKNVKFLVDNEMHDKIVIPKGYLKSIYRKSNYHQRLI